MTSGKSILLCLAVGLGACGLSAPPLVKSEAATLISAARSFNESRRLVAIDAVGQSKDLLDRKFALVRFSFRNAMPAQASDGAVAAMARFYYRDGAWRLMDFSYGEYPDRKVVVTP